MRVRLRGGGPRGRHLLLGGRDGGRALHHRADHRLLPARQDEQLADVRADDLGGPIMIAHLSGQVAQLGIVSLISFIALLSVNLGLVNLLPIPVLDGGHLMFYAAEALRGRPVPPRAMEYGYRVGICFIACVFVFVSWNDLVREGAFKWVAHLAG